MGSSRRRLLIGKALCGAAASVALALAACGTTSVHGRASSSPTARPPTPTATASLATAHAEWTTLASTPRDASNFTFAPTNPQVGYICTQVNLQLSSGQPKLYKTSDGGQHWQSEPNLPAIQLPADAVTFLVLSCNTFVDAADANDVFLQQIALNPSGAGVAIARALYRSRDGGATWGQPLGTLDRTNGFGALAVIGSRLVARAEPSFYGARGCNDTQPLPPEQPSNVLYASDDGGQTWQQIGQSIEDQHLAMVDMAMMGSTIFATAHTLFPGGCSNFKQTYSLWQSADGGTTWQTSSAPATSFSSLEFTAKAGSSGYYGLALGDAIPGGIWRTVYFTADSAATWTPLPTLNVGTTSITDPSNAEMSALVVTPSGAVVAQALQYPIHGGPAGVFAIRPSDAQPKWMTYAQAGSVYTEQLSHATGIALWLLDLSGNTPVLKYLPLP